MKFSMTGQEKGSPFNTGDCLIEVTAWTYLTTYIYTRDLSHFVQWLLLAPVLLTLPIPCLTCTYAYMYKNTSTHTIKSFLCDLPREHNTSYCLIEWVSNCGLMPIRQFFSYIMARTNLFSMGWWWGPLCTRPTRWAGFL